MIGERMASVKPAVKQRLFVACSALIAYGLLQGTALSAESPTVFRPPALDYKKVCEPQAVVQPKLDRDWTTWEGISIDVPFDMAVLIANEYATGSERLPPSPKTALRMLRVLEAQYPKQVIKLNAAMARALIEGASGIEALKEAETRLLKLYASGDVKAAYKLGQLYGSRGPAEMRNLEASKKYMQRSAASGDVAGQLAYAKLLFADPKVSDADKKIQINNALISSIGHIQKGDCSNMDAIGFLYIDGEFIPKNPSVGLEWLERFAGTGNIVIANYLARIYRTVRTDEIDIEKATRYLQQTADAGKPTAAFGIGKLYATGVSVDKNREKAIAYLEAASKGKVPNSGFWLARIYSGEFDFPAQPEKAREIYAGLIGQPETEEPVNEAYGKFLEKYGSSEADSDLAIDLLAKSAIAGSGSASREVGDIYFNLAQKDNAKFALAEKYYRLAVGLGEPHGASRISEMYSCGAGLPLSASDSAKWNVRAADLGSESALWSTGLQGISSTDPDVRARGRLLVRQAALKGSADAVGYLVSRWEKGLDGFEKNEADAARLLRFVAQNPDQVFRHEAELAVISSRFDVAASPAELQAQLDAITLFGGITDSVAALKKSEMLDQAGLGTPLEMGALLKIAADASDARGMREYGKLLLRDPTMDVAIGRGWLEKSAQAGDVKAQLELIDPASADARQQLDKIAASGRVCSVDHMVSIARKYALVPNPAGISQASLWLGNAGTSAGQDSNDLFSIGTAYRDGIAGLPERRKAEEYFSRSLALGRKSAAREIAEGHLKKLWASPDPLKAKNFLLDLLKTGDVVAGNKLLNEYSNSRIPATTNDVKFVIDAMPGKIDAPAKYMFKLARMNEDGKLGAVDEKLAVQWLSLAAAAGDPNAMFRLYNSYINATGVERSPVKAFEWLQKSADAGNYRAAEGLAAAYETGFGLEKDADKSAYWRDKAKTLKVR